MVLIVSGIASEVASRIASKLASRVASALVSMLARMFLSVNEMMRKHKERQFKLVSYLIKSTIYTLICL